MANFTGFRLIAAIWRQRGRIVGISFHVRRSRIGIMTSGTGQTVGIGLPCTAGRTARMAGLAIADVHREYDIPVAAEGSGFLMAHGEVRVVEVRTVMDRVHPIREGAGISELSDRIRFLARQVVVAAATPVRSLFVKVFIVAREIEHKADTRIAPVT